MEIGRKKQEENSPSITNRIIAKINELKNNNYIPLKLEFNIKIYLQILKECNFIKEEDGQYVWLTPGLVEKYKKTPNAFYGIPFFINNDGFDWVIISEEKNNE